MSVFDRALALGRFRVGADTALQRLKMNHHQCRDEKQQRGHQTGLHDVHIGRTDDLRHDEGGRAHDRWHDLTAGRHHRLDGPGLIGSVTLALHHRNGERSGHGDIARRGTRNHPQQGAEYHRGLGRSGGHAPGQHIGKPEEEAAGAEFREKGAENGEQDDVGGRHTDRNSVDALAGERQERDHAFESHSAAVQHAGQIRRDHRVDQKHRRDHGEKIAGCPPRRLHNQQNDQDAYHDVRRGRRSTAERDVLPASQQVEAGAHGREEKYPDYPGPASLPAGLRGVSGQQKYQAEHHRQMHGTNHHRGKHQQP